MAVKRWAPSALATPQVSTFSVVVFDATTSYLVMIGNKTVATVGTTSHAATAAAIAAACAAATYAEFLEMTWSSSGTTVKATGKTAGQRFAIKLATNSGSGAFDVADANTTGGDGPNNWSSPYNWDPASTPASGDDIYLENSSVDVLYNLDQSAVTLGSLNIAASYTGNLGLPQSNAKYQEYRPTALKLGATGVRIGYGPGAGSQRLRLDTGTVATSIVVSGTGPSSEPGLEAFVWKGSNTANKLEVLRGSVGVAVVPGSAADLTGGLTIGFVENVLGDAEVRVGAGTVLAGGLTQTGGDVTIFSRSGTTNLGNLTVYGGSLALFGDAPMHSSGTALAVLGGTVYWNSTGQLYAMIVGDGATLDFSRELSTKSGDAASKPNLTLVKGARLNDPFGLVHNVNLLCYECGLGDVVIDIGKHLTITR